MLYRGGGVYLLLHHVLYRGRVFAVTSSAVQGSSVCCYIKCCTRVECLLLHQMLNKGRVFAVTSSAVQDSASAVTLSVVRGVSICYSFKCYTGGCICFYIKC